MLQAGAGPHYNLPSSFYLPRIFLPSPGEPLVSLVSIKLRDDIVDRLVNVELLAAEDIDESCIPVGEGVNANVALSNYHEPADPPLRRIIARAIDESVRRSDLVHPDNVRKLI